MTKPARAWTVASTRPMVVLGRGQPALAEDPRELPVRRRASGGGAVLTGPWLLHAAVRLPRGHALLASGPAAAARWFGSVHAEWLRRQGLPALALYDGPTQDHWACFGGRGPGEVLCAGRKLVGIAQVWRRTGALLSAGVLLESPPWPLLCGALGHDPEEAASLARATASLREVQGRRADPALLAGSLRRAIAAALVLPPAAAAAPFAPGEPA